MFITGLSFWILLVRRQIEHIHLFTEIKPSSGLGIRKWEFPLLVTALQGSGTNFNEYGWITTASAHFSCVLKLLRTNSSVYGSMRSGLSHTSWVFQ